MDIKLEDKYKLIEGTRFLTGAQALVRVPIVQARRDKKKDLNTACYISGYRGSPLGGYDQQIIKNKKYLNENNYLITTAKDTKDADEKIKIIKTILH